jgi:hypothetical protein
LQSVGLKEVTGEVIRLSKLERMVLDCNAGLHGIHPNIGSLPVLKDFGLLQPFWHNLIPHPPQWIMGMTSLNSLRFGGFGGIDMFPYSQARLLDTQCHFYFSLDTSEQNLSSNYNPHNLNTIVVSTLIILLE